MSKIEKKQERELKSLGFDPVVFGRNFVTKQSIINSSAKVKIKMFINNIHKKVFKNLVQIPYNKFYNGEKEIKTNGIMPYESLWPDKNIYEYYKELISPGDFPKEYEDFWFVDKVDMKRTP